MLYDFRKAEYSERQPREDYWRYHCARSPTEPRVHLQDGKRARCKQLCRNVNLYDHDFKFLKVAKVLPEEYCQNERDEFRTT